MSEQQSELQLEEVEFTPNLTENEINTLSQILGFVQGDEVVVNILLKLSKYADESVVDKAYEKVYIEQVTVEDGSHILPKEGLSMYNNGYVLKIK